MSRLPRAVLLLLKPVLQAIAMLWLMLFRAPRPDVVLLQLPPTVRCIHMFHATDLHINPVP